MWGRIGVSANRTYVLGLTGGIGCGKSEAAGYLVSLGAAHIDADAISRQLTAEGGAALPMIREHFGDGVFRADGTLDRAVLAQIIFADENERRALEKIIHPMVQREADAEIAASQAAVTVLDVPLLFESGLDALCDEVWSMTLDPETQICRVCERDHLSRAQARSRMSSQLAAAERDARATHVISTDRPIEETQAELARLYHNIIREINL